MPYTIQGPGTAYTLLFDDDTTSGRSLPPAFQAVYGSDWRLPPADDQPYTFMNFVSSRDGRISFNEPGRNGGGDISRNLPHDRWLMALLRARADAILVGTSTLRDARNHYWTPETVFRADADAFAALRAAEGRTPLPILVVATQSGNLPVEAIALRKPLQQVVIATSERGADQAQQTLGRHEAVSYAISPGDTLDLRHIVRELRTTYGVADLLSEGGATIYGALLAAGVRLDEFLTVSPIVVGNPPLPTAPRTSLIEGIGFAADHPPTIDLLSVRRVDSYLFQRSRYQRSAK